MAPQQPVNFLYLFDSSTIIETVQKSDRFVSFYPDINLSGNKSEIENSDFIGRFAPIKFILFRLFYCYVVTKDDELFMYRKGIWWKLELPFITDRRNETIIEISASYCNILLLVQNRVTCKTKVFGYNIYISGSGYFGENVKLYRGETESFDQLSFEKSITPTFDIRDWHEILDFENCLEMDEFVRFISCASSTIVYLTSKGRLLASGCNKFGETGQSTSQISNLSQKRIMECNLDEQQSIKPFFVKVVNGDHKTVALTNDGKVFCCGSEFGDSLKEFPLPDSNTNEFVIDIASTYNGVALLTNKFHIYSPKNHKIEITKLIRKKPETIKSCRIYSSGREFFIVINNSTIYQMNDLVSNSFFILTPIYTTSNIKGDSKLSITSEFLDIIYWREDYFTHSLNMKTMTEKLKNRLRDGVFTDTMIQVISSSINQ